MLREITFLTESGHDSYVTCHQTYHCVFVWCALENDFLLINLSYYCTIVPRKLTPRIFTTTNSHWKNGDRLKQGKFTESQFIRHRIDIQLHFFPIHIVLACYG